MRIEAVLKYFSPKSLMITDIPGATASDSLSGTDVMAAIGMTQERAAMGYSAFLGKMGISTNDRKRAIELLAQYALTKCHQVAALRKLDSGIKSQVVFQLATFAFEDYARSAASVKQCNCCSGRGFIEADVFTMKSHYTMKLPQFAKDLKKSPSDFEVNRKEKEVVRVLCSACNGKKVVSCACSDCRGRGKAVNKELTDKQGVPVLADCKRCSGRGYERIPSTEAYAAVCRITEAITLNTWKKSVKPFYDQLITKFDIEEAWANSQLMQITR